VVLTLPAGEFILREKPHTVVCESAVSPEFGTQTGNSLCAEDADAGRSDATALRILFAVAGALKAQPDPLKSPQWREVTGRMYGEQLATIAALASGSRLLYGDRPKAVTYRRLVHMCSAVDLDVAFGLRSARNYAEAVGLPREVPEESIVERVLMREREAALCCSVMRAADMASGSGRSVVALVGM
jgi:hypothetical protein